MASIHIFGEGNYTGEAIKNFIISKAPLTINGGTVAAKIYDNTSSANISGVTYDGLKTVKN
jgi:hypothetical protein